MGLKSCKADLKAKTLTIVMDLEEPQASKSGKTLVVASSRGNAKTGCEIEGLEIIAGVNCYVKPETTSE